MAADRESHLEELAAAVADGRRVDWRTLHARARHERERRQLGHLELIAAMAAGVADEPSRPTPVLTPNSDWGSLRIIEYVGRGRQGEVYRAWDPELERTVALKLLAAAVETSRAAVTEGRLMARVHHPNVVTIFGSREIDGRTGLWMEFVDGPTLERDLAERGPFSAGELMAVAMSLCAALDAVHGKGLVHQDVKTQNVLRDSSGRIVLGDFGTVSVHAGEDAGARGEVAGTPRYMAPELFDEAAPTFRSDIYSLGVLLFRLASGRYPSDAESLSELRRALQAPSPSIAEFRPDLPAALQVAIDTALQRDPNRRFASAREMLQDLEAAPGHRRPWPWSSVTQLACSIAISVAVSGGMTLDLESRPRTETARKISSGVAVDRSGEPSRDGRWLTFVDPATGNLAIQNLATGVSRILTEGRGWIAGDYASWSRLSPDARQVAYEWWSAIDHETQLRVIDVDSKTWRILMRRSPGRLRPVRWTPDGARVLTVLSDQGPPEIGELEIVSARYRRISVLAALPGHIDLSPDGKWLAVDLPASGRGDADIQVIDRQNGSIRYSLAEPANDHHPMWTATGSRMVFLSDRDRTVSLWSVGIAPGGRAPELLKRDVGDIAPAVMTPGGSLYYTVQSKPLQNIFHAPLQGLTASAEPQVAGERFIDASTGPAWSPDGSTLAFYSLTNEPKLIVRSTAGDRLLSLPPGTVSPFYSGPRWFPDSRTLLIFVRPAPGRAAAFMRIDAATGDTLAVHQSAMTSAVSSFVLAPDGSAIFWTVQRTSDGPAPSGRLMRFDLRTRTETELRRDEWFTTVAVSPDSREIAYFTTKPSDGADYPGAVDVMPAIGGTPREVFRDRIWQNGGRYNTLAWTADGRALMFVRDDGQLWQVAVSGGLPQQMGISTRGRIKSVTMHPTRPLLTFGTAEVDRNELWLLENFDLPRARP
jgi:serine/threonine protein kinase/Tol biopolymer transport system component